MRINFISNISLSETSGGWSGINFKIHNELEKHFEINYVGPINPPASYLEKLISKLKRIVGLKGKFFFFSNSRLLKIRDLVNQQLDPTASYNFFFGQSPWIKCEFNAPYGTYMDAAFSTYLSIYLNAEEFDQEDVVRICEKEEVWLKGASDLFMGSDWAWNEMLRDYDLNITNKHTVRVGGNIEIPENDSFKGGLNLLFISLNFAKKGGHICVEVFKKLRDKYPQVKLNIIGQCPPDDVIALDGLNYLGLLDKNNDQDLKRFQDILSQSFFLVHPTVMDTMGAVIIEAGYYSCPSIAPASFGIPELIVDNETGYLVSKELKVQEFTEKLEKMIIDDSAYQEMRRKVKTYTSEELSYESIGRQIKNKIQESVEL